MRRSKLYRYAADALDHGRQYAFRDRRAKKRDFRKLWIVRITAACRAGIRTITAGNYGGKLGPHHFPLREIMASGDTLEATA